MEWAKSNILWNPSTAGPSRYKLHPPESAQHLALLSRLLGADKVLAVMIEQVMLIARIFYCLINMCDTYRHWLLICYRNKWFGQVACWPISTAHLPDCIGGCGNNPEYMYMSNYKWNGKKHELMDISNLHIYYDDNSIDSKVLHESIFCSWYLPYYTCSLKTEVGTPPQSCPSTSTCSVFAPTEAVHWLASPRFCVINAFCPLISNNYVR